MAPDRPRLTALVAALLLAGIAAAQTDWTERTPPHPDLPSTRWEHSMSYDQARGVVVLFGGYDFATSAVLGDTWEWDGARWTGRALPASPPVRGRHGLVYDSVRRVTVLFGGFSSTSLGDTWEYDGTTWLERTPATSPPPQSVQAMVFDSGRGVVVQYANNETWEYDGATWTQRTTANTPPHRAAARMAYDPLRQRTVLLAYISGTATTWEYDGVDWTQRFPNTPLPIGAVSEMAWHAARGRIVVAGGCRSCSSATGIGETWEWDGTDWISRTLAHNPPFNWYHALAAGPGGGVVQFGGEALTIGETWVFDGADWQRPLPTAPRGLWTHAMTYDELRQRTVLFGGLAKWSTGWRNDTWEWDGVRWHGHLPTGREPPRREYPALAYDAARGETVLFGGSMGVSEPMGDTWLWNGSRWARAAGGPPARFGHAMAYDARRQVVVLFGGAGPSRLDDTWEWNGRQWRQRTPANHPSERWLHAMAFDRRRGVTVLFGGLGRTAFGDTWEWDGHDWRQRTPSTSPSPLIQHTMVYDADRERVVLFVVDQTWEWDGTEWRRQWTASVPPARTLHAMAYDPTRREVVLQGGLTQSTATIWGDTWVYAPSVRGSATAFGSGCPGARGVPQLAAAAAPIVGNRDFGLRVTTAPAQTTVLVAVAFTSTPTPLPGGCTAYALPTPLELLGTTAEDGTATLPLPVPYDPALRGAHVFAQALVQDPQGAFLGLASFSPGLRIVIGD